MTVERGSPVDSPETTEETESPPVLRGSTGTKRLSTIKRIGRQCLARWRSIVAATLVVAAVGIAAGVYFIVYQPDQRVGDAAAHRAIQAASDGAVAVLSYSYDHLYRDFTEAKSHLTGDFLAYYSKFTDDVVAPTAQQGQLTATAKVIRAAVSELHPDSAVVLVFVNQITGSVQKKDPETTRSSILVTLTKVHGSWLIAKFDPAG